MENNILKILSELKLIKDELAEIKTNMNNNIIINNGREVDNINYILNLDKEKLGKYKRYLDKNHADSDINLIMKVFIDYKECIRINNKQISYYEDGSWKDYNEEFKCKLFTIIDKLYRSINDCGSNYEKFVKNQNHINKLSEEKYQEKIIKFLKNNA